jgi:hypothetical protein
MLYTSIEGVSVIRASTVPMVMSFPKTLEFVPNSPEGGERNLGEIDQLRDAKPREDSHSSEGAGLVWFTRPPCCSIQF